MPVSERTPGEEQFERYLAATGHEGADRHEPSLGSRRRPDYLVEKGGCAAIAEVKEFHTNRHVEREFASLERGVGFTAPAKAVLAGIRNKVKNGAAQLREHQHTLPLVVVLSNPYRLAVDLSPHQIGLALYGDPMIEGLMDPQTGRVLVQHLRPGGRNGCLTNDHRYLSAVVVLHPPIPGVSPGEHVHVFETIAAVFERTPRIGPLLFDGPFDVCWTPDESGAFRRAEARTHLD